MSKVVDVEEPEAIFYQYDGYRDRLRLIQRSLELEFEVENAEDRVSFFLNPEDCDTLAEVLLRHGTGNYRLASREDDELTVPYFPLAYALGRALYDDHGMFWSVVAELNRTFPQYAWHNAMTDSPARPSE